MWFFELAFGSNWFAFADEGALVTTEDLAEALGGEVQTTAEFCNRFDEVDSWADAGKTQAQADLEREEAEAAVEAAVEAEAADQQAGFFEKFDPKYDEEILELAADPDLTESEVEALFRVFEKDLGQVALRFQQPKFMCALAQNPATPESVMDDMLGVAIANGEYVEELQESPDAAIAICVAKSEQTSTATLRQLTRSPNSRLSDYARENLSPYTSD